ncbi:MAG TPA: aminotransferase class I/II-fold pyridoxal phosphate-dependent enzyme, partial [Nitrospiria bacterium]|nr:aminotransferase class I/II-fold pyridoxal phosphate-dependent enzyme [Nitrospiria bacterium]
MRRPSPTTIPDPFAAYRTEIERLRGADRLRTIRAAETGAGPRINRDGRSLVNFGSNNYLGLAEHPRVKAAAIRAIEREGVGAGASRLLTGDRAVHDELEAALARLKGTEAALVFPTGYQANVGVISSLMGRGDLILADRDCHASLIDGCRASGARFRVYRRDRLDHLQTALTRRPPTGRTLIVTDSVFSMEGDLAPLP